MDLHEFLLYALAAIAYFVPFYIALYRKVNGRQLMFWFNLVFAWTLIAWVLLIVVALSLKTEQHNEHSMSA